MPSAEPVNPRPGTEAPTAPELPSPIECPKCGAAVSLPANVCPACRRHLYLLCPECDQPNFRANVLCDFCGAALRHSKRPSAPPIHRHVWPFEWRVDRERRWLLPTQIALFLCCVALTTLAVILIVEYRHPNRPPEPPEVYVLENGKLKPLEEVIKRK